MFDGSLEGESGQAGDQDLWVTSSAIKLNSGKWTGSDWMDRTRLRPQGDSTGGPSNECGPVCDRTRAQPRRSPRLSGTGWDRQNVQALKRAFGTQEILHVSLQGRSYNSCLVGRVLYRSCFACVLVAGLSSRGGHDAAFGSSRTTGSLTVS